MTLRTTLPADFVVVRGETQKDVNYTVLTAAINAFPKDAPIEVLDLPCGRLDFLNYVRTLFPVAKLTGADLMPPSVIHPTISFVKMDLTRDFTLPEHQKFDLITSISGIMMFSNTLSFIRNCTARLKPGGVFIITNDNSATIIDRLAYLVFGGYRLFRPIYDDTEELTENVPVQELCRLLRTNNIIIERIEYTSSYLKDLIYLPAALVIYPLQLLYLRRLKTSLPDALKKQMYPFKQLFCKHYVITGRKAS